MIDVYEYAMENNVAKHSAIGNPEFRDFFKDIKIDTIVEIGTFRGVSTAYMAQFVNKVYTFDVIDYLEKYKVWHDIKVNNKIFFHIIKGRYENFVKNFEGVFSEDKRAIDIENVLNGVEFDFAFIDGNHTYKDVKADFGLVKKCRRVMFHDVALHFYQVRKFVEEIGANITGNIGYWKGK